MSSGIGFAGYGKYLNERALSLLGKKQGMHKNPYDANVDTEHTSVEQVQEILDWSKKRREVSRPRRIMLLVFQMLFLAGMIAFVIFMTLHAFG